MNKETRWVIFFFEKKPEVKILTVVSLQKSTTGQDDPIATPHSPKPIYKYDLIFHGLT
jgi:hypothetical protein